MKLSSKVAIVTGAASGIGRATAKLFYEQGARVVAVDRDSDGLQTLSTEIKCDIYCIDITNEEKVKDYIGQVYAKYSRIDILANIAGIAGHEDVSKPLHLSSMSRMKRIIDVNFYGTFYHCYYTLPFMAKTISNSENNANYCSIINTSSEQAVRVTAGAAEYCISKRAVNALTQSIASEYGASNIRCNAVVPGAVETPMITGFIEQKYGKEKAQEMIEIAKKTFNSVERFASPQEIAKTFLFLASEDSSFCHGSLIVADGGRSSVYSHFPSLIKKQTSKL